MAASTTLLVVGDGGLVGVRRGFEGDVTAVGDRKVTQQRR
jgi:hypothetical protein